MKYSEIISMLADIDTKNIINDEPFDAEQTLINLVHFARAAQEDIPSTMIAGKFFIIDTILGRVVATKDDEDLAHEIAHKYNNYEDTGRNIVTQPVEDNRNHIINKR